MKINVTKKTDKFVFCILLEDARTFEMRQKLHIKNGTLAFMLAITIKASVMIYNCEETDIKVKKTVIYLMITNIELDFPHVLVQLHNIMVL